MLSGRSAAQERRRSAGEPRSLHFEGGKESGWAEKGSVDDRRSRFIHNAFN